MSHRMIASVNASPRSKQLVLSMMDRMCTRCALLVTRSQSQHYRILQPSVRTLTTTLQQRADDSAPKPINETPPTFRIRKVIEDENNKSTNRAPQGGQLLRRTGPSQGATTARTNGPPPGQLLRRSGPPSQPNQILRRTGPPRQGGRSGTPSQARTGKVRQRRRQDAETVKAREAEDEEASEEEVDAYIEKFIDPPVNPTTLIEYHPQPQEFAELQKDWPNTPMSNTGLSASMVQKLESLARRIPHGYQTPEQLAEYFHKGNLTKFESEEEKEQVLKIAAQLAEKRASMLSERNGSEIVAADMGFASLNSRDEKNKLVDEVVKGEVGELERQRMPFLDSIMRNLRNNETYHKVEMDKFMATIERLVPAQTQRRPQPGAQDKA